MYLEVCEWQFVEYILIAGQLLAFCLFAFGALPSESKEILHEQIRPAEKGSSARMQAVGFGVCLGTQLLGSFASHLPAHRGGTNRGGKLKRKVMDLGGLGGPGRSWKPSQKMGGKAPYRCWLMPHSRAASVASFDCFGG